LKGFHRGTEEVFCDLDDDLAQVWDFMKRFCLMINLTIKARGRITWELYLNSMASLMYRLLYMSSERGSLNEAIRLGLLALSSHVFLQGQLFRVSYDHMNAAYKECLCHLEGSTRVPPHILSWLLLVGAISAFEPPDEAWLSPFLRANIESSGVTSWGKMRLVMESLIWLPVVQEQHGKDFFDRALHNNDSNRM
jgi:hypothetical protein